MTTEQNLENYDQLSFDEQLTIKANYIGLVKLTNEVVKEGNIKLAETILTKIPFKIVFPKNINKNWWFLKNS